MKNESQYVKPFIALLKKMRQTVKVEAPAGPVDPVVQLVLALLEWNATIPGASAAYDRIMAGMVDLNDLRVSLPDDVMAAIGADYPLVEERAMRIHEALHEVFLREHIVAMESIAGKPKKQAKVYLETLPGITPYAIAKVMLMSFGAHAAPIDDHLLNLLRSHGAVDAEASVEEACGFVERHVKAEESAEVHLIMKGWADLQKPSATSAVRQGDPPLSDEVVAERAARLASRAKAATKKAAARKPPAPAVKAPTKVPTKKATTKKSTTASKKTTRK